MANVNSLLILLCSIVLVSLGETKLVENNYAASIFDMGDLISYEHYLLNILQNFTNDLQKRVDTIE